MPTQTFFNLPIDKQEKIIDVAKNEFSSYAFYDASINRIIKEAGIARGSFYQYFENKEDLFIYILDSARNIIIQNVINKLQTKKHNIFEVHLIVFDEITNEGVNGEYKEFIVTTITNMNPQLLNHLFGFLAKNESRNDLSKLIEFVDMDNLKINSIEDFMHLNQMLINLIISEVILFFSKIPDSNSCREELEKKFNLIKYGVLVPSQAT